MDRSAAPWRVLEGPSSGEGPDPDGEDPSGSGNGGAPVPWLVAGAIAVMISLGAVGALLASAAPPLVRPPDGGASGDVGGLASSDTSSGAELVVEVAGAVAHPGLYRLRQGGRVADAIAAAGGYGPRVDAAQATAQLNLAAHVADGDRIVVPSRDNPSQPPSSTGSGSARANPGTSGQATPVDLNRATAAELDALPGIGPVTAAKIIAARDEQRFASVDDLRTRKLVGSATFEKLRALVVVR